MAIKAHLSMDAGATFHTEIELVNDDDEPMDLTGYTVTAAMRKSATASVAHRFLATHDAAGGKIFLDMSADTTLTIVPGRYLYDAFIVAPTGQVTKIVEGVVTVNASISLNAEDDL